MRTSISWLKRQIARCPATLSVMLLALLGMPLAQAAATSLPGAPQPAEIAAVQSQAAAPSPLPAAAQTAPASPPSSAPPVGAAAAPYVRPGGVAASRPAGAAIAPAKQRRIRSIAIRVGLLVGAGVAIGVVVAASQGSPSRPH